MAQHREKTAPVSSIESSQAHRIRALKSQRLAYAESILTRRIEYARKSGLTFEGKRDVSNALGYLDKLHNRDFLERFRRGDIAQTIVKKLPSSTYRDGFTVVENVPDGDDSARVSKFNSTIDELCTRLNLASVMQEAEILQRQAHYSVIYIVAPGEDITVELSKVDLGGNPNNVFKLLPFHEDDAAIVDVEKDWTSSRFNQPTMYQLNTEAGTKRCHWTRIIHIADSLGTKGDPVLEHVWNRLDDREKIIGAGSEMWWVNAIRKVLFDMDPETLITDNDASDLDDDIDKMWHGLDPYAMTRGLTPKSLDVSLHSFAEDQQSVERTIAAAADYPHAVLFGNKTGRLAGIEDSEDYRRTVKAHRQNFSAPKIGLFVEWLIWFRVLDQVDWEVRWPKTETHNLKDKATITSLFARANAQQVKTNGELLITGDEIREDVMDKGSLGDDAIVEMPTPPLQPVAPVGGRSGNVIAASVEVDLVANVVNDVIGNARDAIITARAAAVDAHTLDTDVDIAYVFESSLLETLPGVLLDAAVDGGERRAQLTNNGSWFRSGEPIVDVLRGGLQPVVLRCTHGEVTFISTPQLEQLATSRAGELITELSGDMRIGVQRILNQGIELGWTQPQLMSHLRSSIGLHSRQIDAVFNMMGRFRDAAPGSVVTYGSTHVTIPPEGVTQALVDTHTNKYIDRLLTSRLDRIARTELSRMANEGQHELWRQAQGNGLLPSVNVFRVYIMNTHRHADRDGELVPIGTPFTVEPGVDVNCGCSQGLVQV